MGIWWKKLRRVFDTIFRLFSVFNNILLIFTFNLFLNLLIKFFLFLCIFLETMMLILDFISTVKPWKTILFQHNILGCLWWYNTWVGWVLDPWKRVIPIIVILKKVILALQTFIITLKIFLASITHTHFLYKINDKQNAYYHCWLFWLLSMYCRKLCHIFCSDACDSRNRNSCDKSCTLWPWSLVPNITILFLVFTNAYPDLAIKLNILLILSKIKTINLRLTIQVIRL